MSKQQLILIISTLALAGSLFFIYTKLTPTDLPHNLTQAEIQKMKQEASRSFKTQ